MTGGRRGPSCFDGPRFRFFFDKLSLLDPWRLKKDDPDVPASLVGLLAGPFQVVEDIYYQRSIASCGFDPSRVVDGYIEKTTP